MTASTVLTGNPYVGPRTFRREEADRFFGREREARDLLALVISQRLVLYYAQSGAGKSSLVNTCLIPNLEENGFAVLPVGRVGGELPVGVDEVANIYVFNLMLSLDRTVRDPNSLAKVSLSDFLDRLVSDDGVHYFYDAQLARTSGAVPIGAEEQGRDYVLIVDQFEELITTHPARWRERESFFQQVDAAMAADSHLWVVMVLREDYLAALDPYAHLVTDKLRARFYMQRMGVEAALDAIQEPAQKYGRPFAPGVASALVDNLRRIKVLGQTTAQLGQYVEPVQLQVVCYQLWENLAKQRPPTAGAIGYDYITTADLQAAGDVDTALARYYEETVTSVLAAPNAPVSERQLRTWFDTHLITPAGTRGLVLQGAATTGDLSNAVVRQLQARFLVRTESRAGGAWIELVHDRFVEPICGPTGSGWPATRIHSPRRLTRGRKLAALRTDSMLGRRSRMLRRNWIATPRSTVIWRGISSKLDARNKRSGTGNAGAN